MASLQLSFTYTNSRDLHANVEHLAVRLGIGVVSAEDFIAACEARVRHVLKTILLSVLLAACQIQKAWKRKNFTFNRNKTSGGSAKCFLMHRKEFHHSTFG